MNPSFSDEDLTRLSRQMMMITIITILIMLMDAVFKTFITGSSLIWMHTLTLFVQIALIGLIRRGYARLSAIILIGSIWITLTVENLSFSGLTSPTYTLYFLTILIAGLILGGRMAIVMGIINTLTNFLIFGIHATNDPSAQTNNHELLELAISYSIGWILFSLMMVLADQGIRRSVNTRRADKAQLKNRDIELREAANATDDARTLQTRMAEIVESSSDFVGIVKPNQRVIYVNSTGRKLIGIPLDEDLSQTTIADYHPRWASEIILKEGIPAALQNGIWKGETALLRRDGREIPVIQTIIPHHRPDGTLDTISSAMQDITERKRAEAEQLELALQNERMDVMRDLVDTLAHDLKTPLTVMQTSLDLMERIPDPERQKMKLQIVRQQTAVINDYIQDMLTISRLETLPQHTLVNIDLRNLLDTVSQKLTSKMEIKRISLRTEYPPDLPHIYADEDGLVRAFTNLLENAVNYTPQDGMVALRLRATEGGVLTDVVDNGIGISPEDQSRVFDRFFRAYNGKEFHRGGTGLGLAIVQKIVQQHGGRIELQSKVGVGTTFRVWLPSAQTSIASANLQ